MIQKNKCNFSKISVKISLIKVNHFKNYGKIVKVLDTFIFHINWSYNDIEGKKQEINNVKKKYLVSAKRSQVGFNVRNFGIEKKFIPWIPFVWINYFWYKVFILCACTCANIQNVL